MMKFGIMGAGAVGSYFGAKLAKAGHATVFVGRQGFVDAVSGRGLRFRSGEIDETVPVEADTDCAALADSDVVLCCVKSAGTGAAGEQMKPHLGSDVTVVSFQNGFDNADRLAKALGRPVIPAAIYVAVEVPGPGEVLHHGRGDVVMGSGPTSDAIADVLREAGVPVTVSGQVREALWTKLTGNCALNALSAIGEMPYGGLVARPDVEAVMADIVRECVAVGRAIGLDLPGTDVDAVLAIARAMPAQMSSTAQDLMRGRPSEIDYLNGYVVRRGEELGVPVSANRALQVAVTLLEAGRRPR
ncbi:ketopantoate reductase family protein [Acuticoccus sediminis]|uniref:ketopantoate reductase family protein n=1 Tax=Acuticoccus sediminis TaxID=2184697 RepID=UPI00299DF072|nr:2-dehydropantoate 2-reductase [Acuticoccus sediminis]